VSKGSVLRGAALLLSVLVSAPARAQPAFETQNSGTFPHLRGERFTIELTPGRRFTVGTCGVPGAIHHGDTYLSLLDPAGVTVSSNDDACESLGSQIVYDVPPDRDGRYTVVLDCYSSSPCGGTVAYEISETPPPPPPPPVLRVATSARALLGVDNAGGGVIGEVLVEARPLAPFVLRLGGNPLGLGGGSLGGIAAGSLQLTVGFELDAAEISVGGGIAVLASRLQGSAAREAGLISMHARVGALHLFHVEATGALAVFESIEVDLFSIDITARIPFDELDLALRGAFAHDGTALGEAIVTWWLVREAGRKVFALSFHAGGGGLFYQPVCRFGAACTNVRWYAGPVLGAGMEWRP
jgi:hypothetical protein